MAVLLVTIFVFLFLTHGVQCQFPRVSSLDVYLSLNDDVIPNHGYVDIDNIGINNSAALLCHTNNNRSPNAGGSWHTPDGTVPSIDGLSSGLGRNRDIGLVRLIRRSSNGVVQGIYHCVVPDADNNVHEVYVGLYKSSGGDVTISGGVMYDSDQMTLICISTGGPATNVTWTKDSTAITGGKTVLNNATTANYTHTLNISTGGEYICNVSNDKPSSAAAFIIIPGPPPPTNVRAIQSGTTNITVNWTPPSPNTVGYKISYTGIATTIELSITGGSTSSYTLNGLQNSVTYWISVLAIEQLYSVPVNAAPVALVPYSAAVLNNISAVTATTITITGTVPSLTTVTEFVVDWQRSTSVGCSYTNHDTFTVNGSFASYTITGLEPGNRYSITVRLFNNAGSGPVSRPVTATTNETAPSESPFLSKVSSTPNSITVRWGDVNCLDRNGVITGFVIIVIGSGITSSVTGDLRQTTITRLNPSTRYTFQIVAVNSAGRGPPRNGNFHTEALSVTLEASSYTVSEKDKRVEVCVTVHGINTTCPSSVPYQFTMTTIDKTAVSTTDYKAVSAGIILHSCKKRSCSNITLINDDINEPEECFNVSLISLVSSVTIITSRIAITIIDDDDKPTGVTIVPVSSDAVKVSWSGSIHLSICIQYTVHCFTDNILAQKEVVYGPSTTSAVFSLKTKTLFENIYQHKFILCYLFPSGVKICTVVYFTPDIAHFQIQFGPYYHCLECNCFGHVKSLIEKEIKSTLMIHLYNNCSYCNGLTEEFLTPGFFLCHKSPMNTTYRSTLVNPFTTTTAAQLVGIIKNWVRSRPSLILEGHLVRVNENCPTEISSLDEEECESGVRDDPAHNLCATRELGEQICHI